MENYTLNKTPVRTAKNFGINEINLELDIPEVKDFETIKISSDEMDKISIQNIKNKLINSKIGIEAKSNYSINLTIPEYTKINNPIIINFNFNENNNVLIDNIKIVMEKCSEAEFVLNYSGKNAECFHYLKQEILAKENSKSKVIIANMLEKKAKSFISIENIEEENAKVDYVLVEFGGNTKISNYYSKLNGDFSQNNLKTIYLGTDQDILDINYNIEIYGKNAKCYIEAQGAINGKSHKNFKGTIDFKQGCSNSKGIENENCMILSDEAKSKSLPMLLCKEEDVEGEHGVSSGKIDESKLFYIMTKGISYEDAKRLIVKANFNNIIKEIELEDMQEKIIEKVDKI